MSRSTESRDSSPGSETDKKKHGKDRDHDRDRHHDKTRRKEERHGHRQDRRDNAPMPPMPYSGWSHNLDPYSMQHGYLPPPPYGMCPPPIQQDAYSHNDARSLSAGDPRLPRPYAPYGGSPTPAWPQDYWAQQQSMQQQQMQQQQLQQQQQQQEEHHSSDETAKKAEDFHSPMSMAKRLVKQNVLYLMIVNMPSEEEMAEAAKLLDTQTHV